VQTVTLVAQNSSYDGDSQPSAKHARKRGRKELRERWLACEQAPPAVLHVKQRMLASSLFEAMTKRTGRGDELVPITDMIGFFNPEADPFVVNRLFTPRQSLWYFFWRFTLDSEGAKKNDRTAGHLVSLEDFIAYNEQLCGAHAQRLKVRHEMREGMERVTGSRLRDPLLDEEFDYETFDDFLAEVWTPFAWVAKEETQKVRFSLALAFLAFSLSRRAPWLPLKDRSSSKPQVTKPKAKRRGALRLVPEALVRLQVANTRARAGGAC
jgi:hypothetical protein